MRTAWIILTLAPVTAIVAVLALANRTDAAVRLTAWVWRIPYNRNPKGGAA